MRFEKPIRPMSCRNAARLSLTISLAGQAQPPGDQRSSASADIAAVTEHEDALQVDDAAYGGGDIVEPVGRSDEMGLGLGEKASLPEILRLGQLAERHRLIHGKGGEARVELPAGTPAQFADRTIEAAFHQRQFENVGDEEGAERKRYFLAGHAGRDTVAIPTLADRCQRRTDCR